MVECRQQARFAQQFAEVQVLAVWDLQRDLLVDPRVFGQIDGAESTASQSGQDLVFPEGVVGRTT